MVIGRELRGPRSLQSGPGHLLRLSQRLQGRRLVRRLTQHGVRLDLAHTGRRLLQDTRNGRPLRRIGSPGGHGIQLGQQGFVRRSRRRMQVPRDAQHRCARLLGLVVVGLARQVHLLRLAPLALVHQRGQRRILPAQQAPQGAERALHRRADLLHRRAQLLRRGLQARPLRRGW
jgi:hypothetical protein